MSANWRERRVSRPPLYYSLNRGKKAKQPDSLRHHETEVQALHIGGAQNCEWCVRTILKESLQVACPVHLKLRSRPRAGHIPRWGYIGGRNINSVPIFNALSPPHMEHRFLRLPAAAVSEVGPAWFGHTSSSTERQTAQISLALDWVCDKIRYDDLVSRATRLATLHSILWVCGGETGLVPPLHQPSQR